MTHRQIVMWLVKCSLSHCSKPLTSVHIVEGEVLPLDQCPVVLAGRGRSATARLVSSSVGGQRGEWCNFQQKTPKKDGAILMIAMRSCEYFQQLVSYCCCCWLQVYQFAQMSSISTSSPSSSSSLLVSLLLLAALASFLSGSALVS